MMRPLGPAVSLLALLGTACGVEEPGSFSASVVLAELQADPAADPEGLVEFSVTVDLVAQTKSIEVTLEDALIQQLPLSDSSEELGLKARLTNPLADDPMDPVVRMEPRAETSVRVLNASSTNAELMPWCERPVNLVVTFAGGDAGDVSAEGDLQVTCR